MEKKKGHHKWTRPFVQNIFGTRRVLIKFLVIFVLLINSFVSSYSPMMGHVEKEVNPDVQPSLTSPTGPVPRVV